MSKATLLSSHEARWLAVEAQGLGRPPPAGAIRRHHLRGLVDKIGAIQLDAIRIVERTQFIVPFSRLGAYDPALLLGLSGPGGRLFEYWGHAASLLPVEMQPLFRWRMDARAAPYPGTAGWQARRQAWKSEYADYIAAVLEEVRDRGPIRPRSSPTRGAGPCRQIRSPTDLPRT